jgi:penicillin-binding protein 2
MGMESINKYTEQLGLGTKTGIELGEKAGSIAGPQYADNWGKGEDLSGAIGQSDHGYTPLQLSVYMSTIVTKGTRYRAYLLDSVRKFYTGEVVYSQRAEVMNTVEFGNDTYEILMEGMRQVVEGSDTLTRNFRNVPVTVGGKTGTAEVSGKRANGLFTGFAPFDDPEIVVTCIIEEAEAGPRVSAAVARVMEEYFKNEADTE